MFKKDSRKRRSDRLMFNIPLRVEGLTETGEALKCSGQAVAVNRFGAHIRLEQPLSIAHKIVVTNLENNLRGEFRIVKVLENRTEGEVDLAVESLGNYPTFWGIEFPSRPTKPGESRGLLECQRCRSSTLHPLILDEIEVLEAGGTVRKPCASCGSKTMWKFAMEGVLATLPKPDQAASGEGAAPSEKKQGRRTVFMQRPVSIRTASGEVETVQTENLSKDEIRCPSEKNYEVNQVVTLEWENSGTGRRLQVQGRVRRRQSIAGSRRVVYSIRYEGSPLTLPPAPLKSARRLYVAIGALVAVASVLMEINVRELAYSLIVPSNFTARRLAFLGVVLLLVCLSYKAWKTILAREPESRRTLRKRHQVAAWAIAFVFLGSLGIGTIEGVVRGYRVQQTRMVLRDYAMARIIESNIDAAENRVVASPADYTDVCATLQLLAGKWQAHMDTLSADIQKLYRIQLWDSAKLRDKTKGLEKILVLDRRKLSVVKEQAALNVAAQSVGPNMQQTFWQSSFPPLQQKILELNSKKDQVAKTLAAEK